MAYEPTNWKSGDVVTSAKLNKLEQGVADAGGVLVVTVDGETGALDKTWQEINAALLAGKRVIVPFLDGTDPEGIIVNPILAAILQGQQEEIEYAVVMQTISTSPDDGYETSYVVGIADAQDGYPLLS